MDIDRISYIFGSFARRRQSHEASSAKRRSIESTNKKIFHDRSKSTPHQQSKKTISVSPRARSVFELGFDESKFKCPLCKGTFVEPRVLPCLHTFCLKCIYELERRDSTVWCENGGPEVLKNHIPGSRKPSAIASGYDHSPPKGVRCPTCGEKIDIPNGGISAFPPNYPLQHKMVLATINSRSTHLLCDICTADVSATARCMDCAISFCEHCEEVHSAQTVTANHEVLTLDQAREKGITKVRRQVMCVKHPELELTIFCCTCSQVVCGECILTTHRNHLNEPIARIAKSQLTNLRQAAARTKTIVEESAVASSKLIAASKKIEAHCNKVHNEVEKFIEDYIKAVEDHKINLLEQIKQVKEEKLQDIAHEKMKLQKRIRDARDVAYFLDDLLSDGTEVEVLSFVNPILAKIQECENFEQDRELKLSGSLQFLPEETVKCPNNFYTLYGVVTTQTVSPDHCLLSFEGIHNLRVGKKMEVILETRDHDDMPLERGGEQVTADVRHRDAGVSRSLNVNIQDKRDGTYTISFVPDVAGKLLLSVSVKGIPINGSPFPMTVRNIKPHGGTFHCCSFCSSGGSKEATCGCGGSMPGGYKGCGHGHEGHPGRRHWSCCGNILEHSECVKSNNQYQFTL